MQIAAENAKSTSLLDSVRVENYGVMSPISQVANVSVPDARMLTIKPWDKSMIKAGWQRAVRTRKRNVHAGIIGDVKAIKDPVNRLPNTLEAGEIYPSRQTSYVRYHPFETHGSFVLVRDKRHQTRVSHAARVSVFRNLIQAVNPR